MESGTPLRDTSSAMSKENIEIVRALYEAFARRDGESPLSGYDPDIEWDMSRSAIPRPIAARSPGRDPPADPGGKRGQRHDDPDHQQPHLGRAPAQREGADLSRRGPRLPLSVAGGVRRRGRNVPRRVTSGLTRVLTGATAEPGGQAPGLIEFLRLS